MRGDSGVIGEKIMSSGERCSTIANVPTPARWVRIAPHFKGCLLEAGSFGKFLVIEENRCSRSIDRLDHFADRFCSGKLKLSFLRLKIFRIISTSRIKRKMTLRRPIRGVLLDITGVLYDSSSLGDGGTAISGSIQAFDRLQSSGIPVRVCSNETQNHPSKLAKKLQGLGYVNLREDQVFTPLPAAMAACRQRNLRPHLLVHRKVKSAYDELDQTNPNCVLMGDAGEEFTYDNLNEAFRVLISLKEPILITMGKGKYYMETDGLKIDVGAYARALEYAADVKAEVIGKPSPTYFQMVLDDMGVKAEEAIMVGDDIVSDVQGAIDCGMQAVQVRTGKWRPEWQNHPKIKPSAIADNLAAAVDLILSKDQ